MEVKNKVKTVFDEDPDVEVIFKFIGVRRGPVYDGYRPAHLIDGQHLTSGVHHYYNTDKVSSNGQAKGTITFLFPEVYPSALWVGEKINIQEGEKIVGYATITKIFNSILDKKKNT